MYEELSDEELEAIMHECSVQLQAELDELYQGADSYCPPLGLDD